MPKVSVLMSVYNKERFVAQALDSVLGQTLTDWELIVVDDGSQDGSREIIKRYASHLAVYFSQENQGLARAMNKAFRHARGQYIALLAADDFFVSDALEVLSGYLDEHPEVGLVDSDGYVVDENGRVMDRLSAYRYYPQGSNMVDKLLVNNCVNIGDTALTRACWLEAIKGPFDEAMSGYEDWDLVLRLAAAGCRMVILDVPTCHYRVNRTQKSARSSWIAPKRQRSLEYFVLKTLNSPFFGSASLDARTHFLWTALLTHGRSSVAFQEEVLQAEAFHALPEQGQALLLYYTGLDNLVSRGEIPMGRDRIGEALRLDPGNTKVRLVHRCCEVSPGLLALGVRCWGAIRSIWSGRRGLPREFVPGLPVGS